MRPATAARVLATARELGYDPGLTHSARRLAYQRLGKAFLNQTVAVLLPGGFSTDAYFLHLFQGIVETLAPINFDLLVIYLQPVVPNELPSSVTRGDIDGLITVAGSMENHQYVKRFLADAGFAQRPIVSMLAPIDGCSSALADDVQGACTAAAHLLELGHRHLLHFQGAPETNFHTTQRLAGYEKAYRERDLDSGHYLHATMPNYQLPMDAWGWQPLAYALQAHPEITAVLLPNDWYAAQVFAWCDRAGIRIPDDLSIVGFDDLVAEQEPSLAHRLTTVRVPLYAIGQQAARLLIQRVYGEVPMDVSLTLPTELIVRASTAPPAR